MERAIKTSDQEVCITIQLAQTTVYSERSSTITPIFRIAYPYLIGSKIVAQGAPCF